jgi:hypothetical protein
MKLLEKLTITQLAKKFPTVVEPGGHTTFTITAALNITFDHKLTNSMELSPS